MGIDTKIEWCDHTFNPWMGCAKIHTGCLNCYAESLMDKRLGKVEWGEHGVRVKTSSDNWKAVERINRKASEAGRSESVFCASLADVFETRSDLDPWRRELWELIERCDSLEWLLLTKRPENIRKMLPRSLYRRVWLGTSVSTADTFNEFGERLVQCQDIGAGLFLSAEPLLGPLPRHSPVWREVDWIIVGGESGNGARLCHVEHIEGVIALGKTYEKPVFVKQLGSRAVIGYYYEPCDVREWALDDCRRILQYVGRGQYVEWDHQTFGQPHPRSVIELQLRHGKGGDVSEWPRHLQVRQKPKALEVAWV